MTRTSLAILLVMTACTADGEPFGSAQLDATFGPFEMEAGAERSDLCVSWTIDNDEFVYANAVEMTAGYGFHHSNWFYVPDNVYEGPDGVWPCEERGFNEAVAAAIGGVLFAQSTQARDELQQFPPGVALPIPPGSKIVGGVHMLNATSEPLSSELTLSLHPIDEDDAEVLLSGLSLQFEPLAIPPRGESVFTSECEMAGEHERQLERPLDFDIYYVLPHYHALGMGMTVEAISDGEPTMLYETATAIGEPLGELLPEPFDMTGMSGLRFSCRFNNPRDQTVRWGIGDQEMCIFLAFTDSELLWGGGVLGSDGDPGEPTMNNGVAHFQRDCTLFSYPSSHF